VRDAGATEPRRTVKELVHIGENRIELGAGYRKQLDDEVEVRWAVAAERAVTLVAAEVEGWHVEQGAAGLLVAQEAEEVLVGPEVVEGPVGPAEVVEQGAQEVAVTEEVQEADMVDILGVGKEPGMEDDQAEIPPWDQRP